MIHLKRLFLVLLICAIAAIETFGSGQNRAGTSAAPELRIPVGGRYLAMGGSAVASAIGLEAVYWNPAGVDLSPNSADAIFSYRQYFADMSMSYFGVSGRLGELGTLALSFRNLSVGNINVTTMDQPDGTGEVINPSYFVLGLTYSKQLSDRVTIGATANLINESWARVGATGFSFDAGVEYKDLFNVPDFAVGIVVKNLGGTMTYSGNGLWVQATDQTAARGTSFYEIGAQSSELPSEISLGLSYSRNINEDNKLNFAGAFVNNNYTFDDYKVGLEYSYRDMVFLRGGYLFSPQSDAQTPNIWQNFTAGIGLNIKQVGGVDISFDYAYIPVKYFTANNSFTIKLGL